MGTRRMQVMALLAIFCLAALPVRGDDKKTMSTKSGNRKVAHKSIISEEKEISIGKQYSVEIERSAKMLNGPCHQRIRQSSGSERSAEFGPEDSAHGEGH